MPWPAVQLGVSAFPRENAAEVQGCVPLVHLKAIRTGSTTRTSAPRHPPRVTKSGDQSVAAGSTRALERRTARRSSASPPKSAEPRPPQPDPEPGATPLSAAPSTRRVLAPRASAYALRTRSAPRSARRRLSLSAEPLHPAKVIHFSTGASGPLFARPRHCSRGERWDSNPRPPGPQPGALPAELRPPWRY